MSSQAAGERGRDGAPDQTLVGWLMASRAAVWLLSVLPVPLCVVRAVLRRDNVAENRKDSWQRLRGVQEQARYAAVRTMVEKYAADGFVLDVGCSQGILQEGLRYGRYEGVDLAGGSIALAAVKTDERTHFVCAEGATYRPSRRPDATVLNEVVYYLSDPLGAVLHHAELLAPGGVLVVSIFARTWSSRRLMRRIAQKLDLVESVLVTSGHLAWTVSAFRPR